jgi:hypothetical protein
LLDLSLGLPPVDVGFGLVLDPSAFSRGITPTPADLYANLRRRLEKADPALVDRLRDQLTAPFRSLARSHAKLRVKAIENLEGITVGDKSGADAGKNGDINRGRFLSEGR